jgi:tetratricopeptide (TPR) repeat protein
MFLPSRGIGRTIIAALMLTSIFVAAKAEGLKAAEVSSSLIAKGDAQWTAGKFDDAQKTFEQAVKLYPHSVGISMKLAGFELARNDFSGSIKAYQNAIGIDPKNALAWIGLGISYLHSGSNNLSLAAFDEAVRIDPRRKEQLAPIMAKLN